MENKEKNLTALEFALEVGQQQFAQIQREVRTDFTALSLVDQKKSATADATSLYLKNFWAHYKFLSERLETEKDENFNFYIPLLRALLEFYGELLYFLHQDEKTQIGIFVGHDLLYNSNYYRFLDPHSLAIKAEYERFLKFFKDILDSEAISFPEDIDKFTKKFMDKSSFGFPHFDTILQPKYLGAVSDETFSCWRKDNPCNFYDKYYRTFSDYTHRGFTNQPAGSPGTEKFWITQFLYLIGQLMIELCNKKIFNLAYKTQYDELCQKIKQDHEEMLKIWSAKKPTT
jgi:hypothetical protein